MATRASPDPPVRRRRWSWRLAAGFAVALSIGLAAITMTQGKALSYFSTRPEACANCHIMQSQYDGWQHSSHHAVATCSDCHIPAGFLSKYLAKASNGWHHSRAFTTGDFHEPIMIKATNLAVTEGRCRSCHAAVVDAIDHAPRGGQALACTRCHADVGHLH